MELISDLKGQSLCQPDVARSAGRLVYGLLLLVVSDRGRRNLKVFEKYHGSLIENRDRLWPDLRNHYHPGTHGRASFRDPLATRCDRWDRHHRCSRRLFDALGIHMSEESEKIHTDREIWQSTLATFGAKFVCALSFMIPLLVLPLPFALWVSLIWGLSLLVLFSHLIAKSQGKSSLPAVAEHLTIACVVIALTHFLGEWISTWTP